MGPTAGNKEERSTSSPPRPALLNESDPKGIKNRASGSPRPTLPKEEHRKENSTPQGQQYRLYQKESDPKGRKIVPQGHQDRLYRSSAQQQKQASRSPTTTSQSESTQKGSRMKPEVESSKNVGQKAKPMLIKKKPRDI